MGIDHGSRYSDVSRSRSVTAVLGPTNTGKTHLAIERMLGHESGLIGLPLRLLAREVYDRLVARVGAGSVALITGEEKIKPERPRYWVCTVEAMPRDTDVDFLAIDEVQLAADPERGHVFTDRLLHSRGRSETLLLGAQTIGGAINDLIPGANFISRPRLSKLTYSGQKKITRLPSRTAIVAFGASEVYAIAELIRRQRGGAAVVLGALSPRTRNAQVALYQSGDVDYMVATDAIGMGLNLDVDHVAFAGTRKFDGHTHRDLTPAELAQVAGRAGRHMNDGTFGVTGDVEPFAQEIIDRLENHNFDPVKVLQWRSRELDFGSLERLRESLRRFPEEKRLTRARSADDVTALETVGGIDEIARLASSPAAVAKLWDVCQVPDYRKISPGNHSEMVERLFKFIATGDERIPEDWFAGQVELANRTDGDIDTLANRIAHIRTWTFVSNRADWLKDPVHWQERTRAIEDSLSDALHEQLTQRFVDKRTSALMRGLRDKEEMVTDIAADGNISVESHHVGRIQGFRFFPDAVGDGIHGKAARNAATTVLAKEYAMRARRVSSALPAVFKLNRHGRITWQGEEIAWLEASDNPLKPQIKIACDEHLQAADKEKVQTRLDRWLSDMIEERLKPLVEIANAQDIEGLARGIAFRLVENFGCLKREGVAEEIRSLDQNARAQLRKYGVRFGAFNIYFPPLLKPAAAELLLNLWSLKHAGTHGYTPETLPEPPKAGLTSLKTDKAIPEAFYRSLGFHLCGPRAVRVDMLERLADLIRPLMAWRARIGETPAAEPGGATPPQPPRGATGDGGFTVIPEMMSILGCGAGELGEVLKALGFRLERKEVKPQPVVVAAVAVEQTVAAAVEAVASETIADASATAGDTSPGQLVVPADGSDLMPVTPSVHAANDAAPAPEAVLPPPATADTASAALADVPIAAAAASPAVTEPEFIDIWRPRRRNAEPRRERFHGRRGAAAQATSEASAPASAPSGDPAVAAGAQASAEAGQRREQRGRDRNRSDDRPRGNPQPARGAGEANRGNERRDSRPDGRRDGRPDRGNDGRKGGGWRGDREPARGGPRVTEARPQGHGKSGAVDPDSPFAALSKLKKELEERSQNRS